MRTILRSAITLFAMATSADAACSGSGAVQNCYDSNSGNAYSVHRYGNTSDMQGYNSGTGSRWSQHSQRIGNSTFHNGRDADGNSWSLTQQRIGNTYFYSGSDSNGNF